MQKDHIVLTTQTKLELDETQKVALDAYARLFCQSKRKLTALIQRGALTGLKRKEIRDQVCGNALAYRQFKGVESAVSGMMESRKANNKNYIVNTESKIKNRTKRLNKSLNRLKSPRPTDDIAELRSNIYQQQRGINILQDKLMKLKSGAMSFCFGGKKLLRERSELGRDATPYEIAEWRQRWDDARHDELVLVGSSDESYGNQNCQLVPQNDGTSIAFLRLAPALEAEFGTHIQILLNIRFYHDEVLAAASNGGTPLTYRFKRKNDQWYVYISFRKTGTEMFTSKSLGALGIDLNADHLAVTLITGDGNYKQSWTMPLPLSGKTTEQRSDIIGNAVKECTDLAERFGVPVIIEDLDFSKKKRALDKAFPKQARMLSALAYNKLKQSFISRCARLGIELVKVNPAYTSQLGGIKYEQRFGLSRHHSAAMVIARRGLGFKESCPKRIININNGSIRLLHSQDLMNVRAGKFGKTVVDRFNRALKAHGGYVLDTDTMFNALAENGISVERLSGMLYHHVQKTPDKDYLALLTKLRIEQ